MYLVTWDKASRDDFESYRYDLYTIFADGVWVMLYGSDVEEAEITMSISARGILGVGWSSGILFDWPVALDLDNVERPLNAIKSSFLI